MKLVKGLKEKIYMKLGRALKRAFLFAGVGALAVTGLASCTNSNKEKEVKDYGTLKVSFPAGNIRVTIDIIAEAQGFFAEEGVKVEKVAVGGTAGIAALQTDELDVMTAGFVPDIQAIAAGTTNLRFIAGTAVEGGAIIAKKGSASNYKGTGNNPINIDAFKNVNKYALVRNEASWVISRQYLLDNNVSQTEVTGLDSKISYLAENVDVALAVAQGEAELGFLPMEFALLYSETYDIELVAAAGDLQPNYVCCRELTTKEKLEANHDAFLAYEKARIRAWEFYYNQQKNEDTVVAAVVKHSGKEEAYVRNYIYGGVTKFSADPNTKGIEKWVEAGINSKVFGDNTAAAAALDVKSFVDTSIYEEALKSLYSKNKSKQFYKDIVNVYNNSNYTTIA